MGTASDDFVAVETNQEKVRIIEESSRGSISNENSQTTSEFKITHTSDKRQQPIVAQEAA